MKIILQRRAVYIGLIVVIGLFTPMVVVHEAGHTLVCVLDGFSYKMDFNLLEGSTYCNGTPTHLLLYYALGGGLAMIVLLSPFIAFKWINQHTGVVIGLLTLATHHGVNAVIETFWHVWYVNNTRNSGVILGIIISLSFFAYIFLFARMRR